MDAAYVFAVTFRLDPDEATVDPDRFETTLEIPASEPGADGWLFFRDRLWRGEIGDGPSFRRLASDRLGVEVVAADFRELRTDQGYLDALTREIAADLDRFNAESADEVCHKYLGSSIHVRE
ncbi:LWR-salt protein [Halorubrum sp. FL23]|uniref:LWR-salt protein n=1 Tax=Halorubrum sp. FL23 TaxID=3458704 RepID=UPI0040333748